MKKVLTLIAIAAMSTLVACGPSAEEKAAAEKAKQDSIAASEAAKAEAEAAMAQKTADSLAAIESAKAAKEAAMADSIAKADEAKAKKGGKPVKKAEPPVVKAGQGKG
jgi:hypothetical protein